MKVRASLIDVTGDPVIELPDVSRDVNKILQPGKLTFLIEMIDSQSVRVMARAADTEKSPQLDQPEGTDAASGEVLAAAEHWAVLFRKFLDTNLA